MRGNFRDLVARAPWPLLFRPGRGPRTPACTPSLRAARLSATARALQGPAGLGPFASAEADARAWSDTRYGLPEAPLGHTPTRMAPPQRDKSHPAGNAVGGRPTLLRRQGPRHIAPTLTRRPTGKVLSARTTLQLSVYTPLLIAAVQPDGVMPVLAERAVVRSADLALGLHHACRVAAGRKQLGACSGETKPGAVVGPSSRTPEAKRICLC